MTKTLKPKCYDFFSDPGHGWLKVPLSELERLSIVHQITSYSYQRGLYAYLEEDLDAATFLNAKRSRGEEFRFRERNCTTYARIRSYQSFGEI